MMLTGATGTQAVAATVRPSGEIRNPFYSGEINAQVHKSVSASPASEKWAKMTNTGLTTDALERMTELETAFKVTTFLRMVNKMFFQVRLTEALMLTLNVLSDTRRIRTIIMMISSDLDVVQVVCRKTSPKSPIQVDVSPIHSLPDPSWDIHRTNNADIYNMKYDDVSLTLRSLSGGVMCDKICKYVTNYAKSTPNELQTNWAKVALELHSFMTDLKPFSEKILLERTKDWRKVRLHPMLKLRTSRAQAPNKPGPFESIRSMFQTKTNRIGVQGTNRLPMQGGRTGADPASAGRARGRRTPPVRKAQSSQVESAQRCRLATRTTMRR